MKRSGKIVASLVDAENRPVIEVYETLRMLKKRYYYRVLGGQGERMSGSQSYPTLTNAKRGALDLYNRLNLSTWVWWDKV